jgi:hypothetical protein
MLDVMRIDKTIMVTTGKGAVPVTGLQSTLDRRRYHALFTAHAQGHAISF